MSDASHISPAGATAQKADRDKIRQHLSRRCGEIALRHLAALLAETLESADKVLQEKAGMGDSGASQGYQEALGILRSKRQHLGNALGATFWELYEKSWLPPANAAVTAEKSLSLDELSLVEEGDLEEQLAVDHLTSKLAMTHKDQCVVLAHRANAIDKALPADHEGGPLSPSSIAQMFRGLFKPLGLDARAKVILFKLIDRHGQTHFGAMYQEANDYLASKGVLPDFKPSQAIVRIKQTQSQKLPAGKTAAGAADAPRPPQEPAQGEGNVFGTLMSLMEAAPATGYGSGQAILPAGMVPSRPFVTTDVVSAFSELQQKTINIQDIQDLGQIRAHMAGELTRIRSEIAAGNVNSQDAHTIDLVGMLFDFIYDEPNLSDRLKAVLSRLQMPMFKVAILDKDFFGNKSHPARVLLNTLSHAGIAGGEIGDDDALFEKIQEIVRRILEEFTENMQLFSDLLGDFEAFLASQRTRQQEAEQDQLRAARRKDLEARAARQVEAEVNERIGDLQLPPILTEFFLNPWKEYVVRIAANEGAESERYRSIMELMTVLLWSIEPLESAADRKRLAQSIPTVLTALRQIFRDIPWDADKTARLYQKLEQYHFANLQGDAEKCLRRKNPAGSGTASSYLSDDMGEIGKLLDEVSEFENSAGNIENIGSEDIVLQSQDLLSDPFNDDYDDDDEFMAKVREMPPGQWLEFRKEDARSQRAKLEWKGDVVDEYYFVNWRYQIVAVRHMKELADELRHGKARLIEDLPLVDKALSTIMDRLLNAKKTR